MSKYDGRMKAIEKKMPHREIGDFEIWIGNGDGTSTGPEGKILTDEQLEKESAGDLIITISDEPGTVEKNAEAMARWQAGRGG
jgi:hypothetical protein